MNAMMLRGLRVYVTSFLQVVHVQHPMTFIHACAVHIVLELFLPVPQPCFFRVKCASAPVFHLLFIVCFSCIE